MLGGRRFVLTGLTRLTVVLAEELLSQEADVVIVGERDEDETGEEIFDLLGGRVRFVGRSGLRARSLVESGLAASDALLVLGGDDLENLRYVAAAREVAPQVPVVLRTFQPELADHLSDEVNIRRAFSVTALSAPAFVAAAAAEEVVDTLRLGDDEVLLCVLGVHERSPLVGRTTRELEDESDCAVVAVGDPVWRTLGTEGPVEPLRRGQEVLVGGRLRDVLRLALDSAPPRVVARRARTRRVRSASAARTIRRTLLPLSIVAFVVVFLATALVNAAVYDLRPIDAVQLATGTALGNSAPPTPYDWVKLFNLATTVAAVGLLWVLLSYLTALVLAERLETRMVRRARRLHDHVVVVGLGRVGYRVVRLLLDLGIPAVAVERDAESRFVEAVGYHTPVVTGDGRLAETLLRAGADQARCVIACANDDLANLVTCAEARKLNPSVRTVSHTFDDRLVEHLGATFQVDRAISSNRFAVSAFLGAAVDDAAIRRIRRAGLDLAAFRYRPDADVGADEIAAWRSTGLRVLGVLRDGRVEPPAFVGQGLLRGDEAVVVGPPAVVSELLAR